ncbi:MAG: YdcF family protein [Planctomycetota bacterium]|jgi:uncharacterized SAM-binding protein YcdF (DUF218 family)
MHELIESMTTPIMWAFVLMLVGLILASLKERKRLSLTGHLLIIAAALVLYLFSIPAISGRLLYSLECRQRYPGAEVLSNLDLVVVLGAGYNPAGQIREFAEPTPLAYARVFGGVKAFKNSQAKALIFCEGWDEQAAESGAEVMKRLAMELGVREDKIITEDRSQNTMDNAVQLKKLLVGQDQSRIGLVTSALHMPRSLGVFERVFSRDVIVPVPVGYRFDNRTTSVRLENFIPSSRALKTSTDALHEWIGMLWYAIRY